MHAPTTAPANTLRAVANTREIIVAALSSPIGLGVFQQQQQPMLTLSRHHRPTIHL